MITSAARTELEESILACCKALFLTSAENASVKREKVRLTGGDTA